MNVAPMSLYMIRGYHLLYQKKLWTTELVTEGVNERHDWPPDLSLVFVGIKEISHSEWVESIQIRSRFVAPRQVKEDRAWRIFHLSQGDTYSLSREMNEVSNTFSEITRVLKEILLARRWRVCCERI